MRNIERIDVIMKAIGEEWKRQSPDLRFGQFLENNGLTKNEIFYIEDVYLLNKFFPNIPKREYLMIDGYNLPIMDINTEDLKKILGTDNLSEPYKLGKSYRNTIEEEIKYRRKIKLQKLQNINPYKK